jgi:hypothetical protein
VSRDGPARYAAPRRCLTTDVCVSLRRGPVTRPPHLRPHETLGPSRPRPPAHGRSDHDRMAATAREVQRSGRPTEARIHTRPASTPRRKCRRLPASAPLLSLINVIYCAPILTYPFSDEVYSTPQQYTSQSTVRWRPSCMRLYRRASDLWCSNATDDQMRRIAVGVSHILKVHV